jgi:hypothetical protein
MQINVLKEAKNKIARLKEIIISPVQPQQQGHPPMLSQDISKTADSQQPNSHWLRAKKTAAAALMLIGAITVFVVLVGMFITPGVQRRGAEMQRLQRDFRAGKISWEQYAKGYDEVTKK